MTYNIDMSRRVTREVTVGDLKIGSGHPIRVQSMTCTETADAKALSLIHI